MTDGRVLSLAPSATATLTAMGASDLIVGATHHCDVPNDAGGAHGTSPSIVGSWLDPSIDAVIGLDSDVVFTSDALQSDLADTCRDHGLNVHHSEPSTLDDVIETFPALGRAVGRTDAGCRLADRARRRRALVADAVRGLERPTVYCEEWSDPPMAAGNWVPDVVRAAGGRYPFVDAGDRSRPVDPDEVSAADPDHVVLHICGHGARVDPDSVRTREWEVDAPVHVLDDSLLNQPSPTLFDGVERLAALIHPEIDMDDR